MHARCTSYRARWRKPAAGRPRPGCARWDVRVGSGRLAIAATLLRGFANVDAGVTRGARKSRLARKQRLAGPDRERGIQRVASREELAQSPSRVQTAWRGRRRQHGRRGIAPGLQVQGHMPTAQYTHDEVGLECGGKPTQGRHARRILATRCARWTGSSQTKADCRSSPHASRALAGSHRAGSRCLHAARCRRRSRGSRLLADGCPTIDVARLGALKNDRLAAPKNQREDHAADDDGPDPDNPRVVDHKDAKLASPREARAVLPRQWSASPCVARPGSINQIAVWPGGVASLSDGLTS